MTEVKLKLTKGKEYTLEEIAKKIYKVKNKIVFNISRCSKDEDHPYPDIPVEQILIVDNIDEAIQTFNELRNKSDFKVTKKALGGVKKAMEDEGTQTIYECMKVEETQIMYKSNWSTLSSHFQLIMEINNLEKKSIKRFLKKTKFLVKIKNFYTKKIYKSQLKDPIFFEIDYQ